MPCYHDDKLGVVVHTYPVDGFSTKHVCDCGERTTYNVNDNNYTKIARTKKEKGSSMYDDMVSKEFYVVKGTNKKLGLTFTLSHLYHTKEEAEKVARTKRSKMGADWVLWTKIMKVDNA